MGRALFCWLVVAAVAAPGLAEPQTAVQRKCIHEMHKRLGAVVKSQGQLGSACLKQISRDQLVGLGWSGCSDADADGKVAKAAVKMQAAWDRKCDPAELPTGLLPLASPADTALAAEGARAAVLGLGADVLAQPATVVRSAGDKLGARCQREMLVRSHKLLDVAWRETVAAVDDALAAGAANAAEVAAALEPALSASAKLAKTELQLASKTEKKCAEVSAPLVFRGVCTAATTAEVAACAAQRARCRLCLALTGLEGLPLDCDSFDDAATNLSCSPFS
jgi:hypothetical protein